MCVLWANCYLKESVNGEVHVAHTVIDIGVSAGVTRGRCLNSSVVNLCGERTRKVIIHFWTVQLISRKTHSCFHTSNTWMLFEVINRATPMPMKAAPIIKKPGITMPAESIGCHAGSLCCVKAVLSGRLADSCSCFTIFLLKQDTLLISSPVFNHTVTVVCLQHYFKCSLLYYTQTWQLVKWWNSL